MEAVLESSRTGHVLHLCIQRPEKRNALNAALCRALCETIEAADHDPAVHVVLLTGAGKSFCAGMDLSEIAAPSDPDAIDALHERLFTLGSRISTPIVAAVQGAALGGGTGLVANCHIVVAATGATFGLTEVRLGLWPFLVFRACAAAMGERRTLELSLTGRIYDAEHARSLGLVHEVAPDAAARALEIAQQVAVFSRAAIRAGMSTVRDSRGQTWERAGEVALAARKAILDSPEFRSNIAKWAKKE